MVKQILITVIVLLLVVFVQPGLTDKDSDYNLSRLQIKKPHSGKADKTVKIVIVGDGYVKKDLAPGGKYEGDCQKVVNAFLKKAPFRQYQDYFSIYVIYAESYTSGAENNPGEDKKRNILDTTVETNPDGTQKGRHILIQKPERLGQIVKKAWIEDLHIALVIVNDQRNAGTGNVLIYNKQPIPAPTFTTCGDFENTALHEIGHSFANLADEYVDYDMGKNVKLAGAVDFYAPNVTLAAVVTDTSKEALIKTLKWGHFLELPGTEGIIGLYSGGYYLPKGVYRPQADCFMRGFDFNVDFCFVCQEAIIKKTYQKLGLAFDDREYHQKNPIQVKVKEDYFTVLEKDINYYFDMLFQDAEKSLKTAKDKKFLISSLGKVIEEHARWLEKPGFISTLPMKNPRRLSTIADGLRSRLENLKKVYRVE
ncbi:MAG: hypothetical protein HZA49_06350 [Planctomycetes bacterium]|nr:hypothetical protein [Planctomycetota bacterium]